MANVRSDIMAGLFSTPPTLADIRAKGRLRVARCHVVTATEAAGTKFVLCRLKATDRVVDILLANPAAFMAATGVIDIGLYVAGNWGSADQTVKAVDCYVDGRAGDAANTAPVSVIHLGTNAVVTATDEHGAAVWVLAGDTSAPAAGTEYDLVATTATAACVAGEFTVTVLYLAGD